MEKSMTTKQRQILTGSFCYKMSTIFLSLTID